MEYKTTEILNHYLVHLKLIKYYSQLYVNTTYGKTQNNNAKCIPSTVFYPDNYIFTSGIFPFLSASPEKVNCF